MILHENSGQTQLQEHLKDAPIRRLATGREAAAFLLFLSCPESDFFAGQVFPYAGGWVA